MLLVHPAAEFSAKTGRVCVTGKAMLWVQKELM